MKNSAVIVFVSLAIVGIVFLMFSIKKDVSDYIEASAENPQNREEREDRSGNFNNQGDDEKIMLIESGGSSAGGGSGSSGSSGGSGGSSGGSVQTECVNQQIAYALKNLQSSVDCGLGNGLCSVNCSLDVHNLDESLGGSFKVRINFNENSNIVDYEAVDIYLNAGNLKKIESVKEFQSDEIYCTFESEEIPYREFCF